MMSSCYNLNELAIVKTHLIIVTSRTIRTRTEAANYLFCNLLLEEASQKEALEAGELAFLDQVYLKDRYQMLPYNPRHLK